MLQLRDKVLDRDNKPWKMPTYVLGGVLGVVIGVLSAHFYAQSVEENQPGSKPVKLDTGDMIRLGLAAIGMVRMVSDIGARDSADQA